MQICTYHSHGVNSFTKHPMQKLHKFKQYKAEILVVTRTKSPFNMKNTTLGMLTLAALAEPMVAEERADVEPY